VLRGVLGQVAQHGGGQTRASVAVAGGVGRTGFQSGGDAVSEDARDGVAAGGVVAEDLREEAPDGGTGAEDSVAEQDALLVERVEDAVLAQGGGEGRPLTAREGVAALLEGRHGLDLNPLEYAEDA